MLNEHQVVICRYRVIRQRCLEVQNTRKSEKTGAICVQSFRETMAYKDFLKSRSILISAICCLCGCVRLPSSVCYDVRFCPLFLWLCLYFDGRLLTDFRVVGVFGVDLRVHPFQPCIVQILLRLCFPPPPLFLLTDASLVSLCIS